MDDLKQLVTQQISLSLGMSIESKNDLLAETPSLTENQLKRLQEVFEEEDKKKDELLHAFFAKNPDTYYEYQRFANERVNDIYAHVEHKEIEGEKARLEEIAKTDF